MLTIEELLNYDYGYLQKYIVKLPDSDYKKSVLRDPRIRDLFLNNPEAHYSFVYLVQELDEEALPYFVDKDLILKLKNKVNINDRRDGKFNAIMTCAKPIVNELLIDDNFCEYMLTTYDNRSNLDSLNSTFGKAFINYVIEHYPGHIDLISQFRDNVQDEILDENMISKIFDAGIKFDFISGLSISPLSRICKDPRFTNIISEMNIRSIDMIVFNGVTLSKDLQDSRSILDKYLAVDDIDDYRSMVDRLALNNSDLYEHIKRIRNLRTDRLVSSITPNMQILPMFEEEQLMNSDNYGVIDEFYRDTRGMSSEEIEEYRKLKSKQHLFKLLSDRYFEEKGYNLQANLIEMFKYMGDFNPELMSEESYNLYSRLLNYKSSSLYELAELYKGLNPNTNYLETFYDDYRRIKNTSYGELNSQIIESNSILNNPSYIKDGIKVLELKGEPFISLAHTTANPSMKAFNTTTSLSLIGDTYMGLYDRLNGGMIFGFDQVPEDQIAHVYHADSGTGHEFGTIKVNEIYSPNKLLEDTNTYNEILLNQKHGRLNDNFDDNREYIYPSYIISLNSIKELELETAKKHNLPILLIYQKYYAQHEDKKSIESKNYFELRNPSLLK